MSKLRVVHEAVREAPVYGLCAMLGCGARGAGSGLCDGCERDMVAVFRARFKTLDAVSFRGAAEYREMLGTLQAPVSLLQAHVFRMRLIAEFHALTALHFMREEEMARLRLTRVDEALAKATPPHLFDTLPRQHAGTVQQRRRADVVGAAVMFGLLALVAVAVVFFL